MNANQQEAGTADEIRLLRDSAADFVKRSTNHQRTRALRETLPGHDADVLRSLTELGWPAILVPESHGGMGLGLTSMAAVLRELGRGLLGEPVVANWVLPIRALEFGDNDDLKAKLLPQMAEGKVTAALAFQERNGDFGSNVTKTTAVTSKKTVLLSGTKRFVAGCSGADGFLVTANADAGTGLYWIRREAPGLTLSHEWHADGTASGILSLSDAPAEAVAATPATCAAGLARALDEGAVMVCAELLGILSETLDRTLDYLRTRVQFDKPIGSFQALQHKTVDLFILQEICQSVLEQSVRVMDESATTPAERGRMASRCKARLSDAGLRVTREAIQLHGAIAMTDDCDIGLYFKRAITLSAWLGNAEYHRRRFASLQPSGN